MYITIELYVLTTGGTTLRLNIEATFWLGFDELGWLTENPKLLPTQQII